MGRKRKGRRSPPDQEKYNRDVAYPTGLCAQDMFWYRVLRVLGATQEWILTSKVKETLWRSSDGMVRRLKDIDSEHLLNIYSMMQRIHQRPLPVDARKMRQIKEELQRRFVIGV